MLARLHPLGFCRSLMPPLASCAIASTFGTRRALHVPKRTGGSGAGAPAFSLSSSSCGRLALASILQLNYGWNGAHTSVRNLNRSSVAAGAAGTPPPDTSEFLSNFNDSNPEEEATCIRCTLSSIPGEISEELSDVLLSFGAQSVVIQEHRDLGSPEQEIYEDGKNASSRVWDDCDVVAHFDLETDIPAVVAICEDALERPQPFHYSLEPVQNMQWVDQIKASYVPLKITDNLYIVPEWSEPEDSNAVNIILVPGVAFGTGEHPTTRLCLLQLTKMDLGGLTLMDYGAGSGVLAFAALKMGAVNAACTDVDSLAVKSVKQNAKLNQLQDKVQVYQCGPSLHDEEPLAQAGKPGSTFDVVVANILRGPLVELAPRLIDYCKPGGTILLSGILSEQVPEIQEAYADAVHDLKVETDGLWACVLATKRH